MKHIGISLILVTISLPLLVGCGATVKVEGKTAIISVIDPASIIFGLTPTWHSGTQALNYAWAGCNFP